ncbi:MAG TPA: thiamine pyrophosphate-dependent enzyme [Dehalococcoidia bacterium]|nr:thiamine pyrophosphate-dependent enzyme [Dehalococcoidia bacterium]
MTISRGDALRAIAQHRDQRIVVSTMQVLRPWHALSPSELNLSCIGFMGGASTLGLGVALAQPERRVVILDGDGSLLMQLGSIATIAGAAPANFCHILFQNGVYETSGSQPIASAEAIDFAQMAKGAGYKAAYSFDDVGRFREEVAGILDEDGPVFVVLKIDQRDEMADWDAPSPSPLAETRTVRKSLTGDK